MPTFSTSTNPPLTCVELFAGAGGMAQGLHSAGFTPLALVEWDAPAAGVLAHRFPGVPLFCDVTNFTGEEVGNARVDLLAFGSPCQDLSVAGKRKGLTSGTRSSLFFHAIRIANQLRLHNGLRFLLWENVVGALSSNQGADFAAVLGEVADLRPRDIAWRVLDSQWFGVPQRRRRIFVVADFGGERAAEILSLAQSLRGDHPPRREAREATAGTLAARTNGGGGLGTDFELGGGLQARPTLAAKGVDTGQFLANGGAIVSPTVPSKWSKGTGGPAGDECQNLVAHTLRGEGFDASEDGTGRGTPLVAFGAQNSAAQGLSVGEISPTLDKANTPGVLAFQSSQSGIRESDTHATLDANNGSRRHNGAVSASGVRRLTPRECERLQGWPDDWTLYRLPLRLEGNRWHAHGAPVMQADGPRYKQCGNGVTRQVAEWIATRMAAVIRGDALPP